MFCRITVRCFRPVDQTCSLFDCGYKSLSFAPTWWKPVKLRPPMCCVTPSITEPSVAFHQRVRWTFFKAQSCLSFDCGLESLYFAPVWWKTGKLFLLGSHLTQAAFCLILRGKRSQRSNLQHKSGAQHHDRDSSALVLVAIYCSWWRNAHTRDGVTQPPASERQHLICLSGGCQSFKNSYNLIG